jgi:hypothetical protein
MSSPCGSCLSYPCACPKVTIDEGRYSYQAYDHCTICFKTPCVCSTMSDFWQQSDFNTTDDAYCIGCSHKPCICPGPTMVECWCGQCKSCFSRLGIERDTCQCEKYKQIIKMLLEDY